MFTSKYNMPLSGYRTQMAGMRSGRANHYNMELFHTMSLKSLERLLCTVILPSSMYGLALHESHMNADDFQYLDVVQGRLIKAWFGVSKFCSSTALREAIGWKLASEVVVCHLRHGVRMGSFVEGTSRCRLVKIMYAGLWACG